MFTLVAAAPVPPPRLSYELRDDEDRLLAGGGLDTVELAWRDDVGEVPVRFDIDSLPLAEGHFHFALSLASSDSGHLYHRLEHVAPFAVHAEPGARGAVLLDGRWSAGEVPAPAELRRS
jgi:hypothetical protein